MKKQIRKSLIVSLLLLYTIFSSGILVSIHQCCNHCFTEVEVEYCECVQLDHTHPHTTVCDDSHHQPGDGHAHADHHTCHDFAMLLKIADSYDKAETKVSLHVNYTFLYELLFSNDQYLLTLFNCVLKANKESPSSPFIQGDSFLDYSQQRLFYA